MDRRALHSHGIAAGSRARRESGPGARQWRSSLLVLGQQCPGEAACTTQRPAAGLHQGTWLPGSNLVPRGSGLLLAEGHLRGRPAGLGEHQHTLPALGHRWLLAKASWWPCFYLPRREKRSRITVALIAHQLQALATMLCYYYHYYHAVCETEFVRKDNLAY